MKRVGSGLVPSARASRGQSKSGSVRRDRNVSRGRPMTPKPSDSFTELAGLLARGYLRLLAASGKSDALPGSCNSADTSPGAADSP
jgi:hypothetical protein